MYRRSAELNDVRPFGGCRNSTSGSLVVGASGSTCVGIAITGGPIIGGVVTDLFGWRWAFLINPPICIAMFIAIAAFVDESRDHEAERLDYAGILTFSAGLFLLIWALIDGNGLGWAARPIVERFVGAAVLLVAFLFVELVQKRPMVDFTLFAQSTFLGSAFAMLGYAGGAQVMIFYLPLFLQNAFDLSPAMAGLAMLPFALPMFLTPRLGAGLARRYSGRTLLTAGLMTTVIGNLLLWALARSSLPYPAFLLGMLVAGAGAGLLNSETTKVMQGAVPAQRAGMASGLTATTRYIGVLVGSPHSAPCWRRSLRAASSPAVSRPGSTPRRRRNSLST